MQLTFKELVKEQVPPQVIVTAAFVIMLTIGYGAWSAETSGSFTIMAPLYATEVYVDTGRAGVLKNPGEKVTFDYPVGKHTIIVSRGGYWPWKKEVNIIAKQNIVISPFLVRQEIKPEEIPQFSLSSDGTISQNMEYSDALSLFSNIKIADEITQLVSDTSLKNVRAADYFPGRKDVLIVAVQEGIFAIDTTQNEPRNFQPVYKGNSPIFIKTANDIIFIKDGDTLFRVSGIN